MRNAESVIRVIWLATVSQAFLAALSPDVYPQTFDSRCSAAMGIVNLDWCPLRLSVTSMSTQAPPFHQPSPVKLDACTEVFETPLMNIGFQALGTLA